MVSQFGGFAFGESGGGGPRAGVGRGGRNSAIARTRRAAIRRGNR